MLLGMVKQREELTQFFKLVCGISKGKSVFLGYSEQSALKKN